jgi:hypothetical protein
MGKIQPVHRPGHLNIGEQHMDPNGMLLESIQSSFSMPDFHYLDALVSKHLGDQKTNQLFVFSNKDQDFVRHAFPLR